MGLLDDIRARNEKSRPGTACGVPKVAAKLAAKQRAEFLAAVEDSTITGTAVADVMQARGFHLSALTVGRHRRGECRCDHR